MLRRILVGLLLIQIGIMLNANAKGSGKYFLYVGSYADKADEGIYLYEFDAENGDLEYVSTTKGIKNPSYLVISEKKNFLFAANETQEYQGEKTGYVTSFSINAVTGQLIKINEVASGGGAPCYISLNKSVSMAFVANYVGGNVCAIPIEHNGKLNEISSLIQHDDTGTENSKQGKAHAHFIDPDPSGKYALAVDLGMDKVISYKIDQKHKNLVFSSEINTTEGAGPRHLVFHPNKKLVFVINELNSTLTSCSYDLKTGKLSKLKTVSTLPAGFEGESYCADIHVSPDGRFLYGSNRGHNSIVVYEIDKNSGELSLVSHHQVKGDWPRNFIIDPSGKFLLVANERSNNIVVFKIDKETGMLRSNGVEISVNKPVCLKMMPIKE